MVGSYFPHCLSFFHERRNFIIRFIWIVGVSTNISIILISRIGRPCSLYCNLPSINIQRHLLQKIRTLKLYRNSLLTCIYVLNAETYTAFPLWNSPWWTVPYCPWPNISFFSIALSEYTMWGSTQSGKYFITSVIAWEHIRLWHPSTRHWYSSTSATWLGGKLEGNSRSVNKCLREKAEIAYYFCYRGHIILTI